MSDIKERGEASTEAPAHVVFAHRGVRFPHGDNAVPAFEAAIVAGYGIETDVRRTRDGVLVLVHDHGVRGVPVESLDFEQLPAGVVSLRWLLERCSPDALLNLEIKYFGLAGPHGPIEAAVRDELACFGRLEGEAEGSTVISSFSPGCLSQFRRLAPALPCLQVVEGVRTPDASRDELLDIVRRYAIAVVPDAADLATIPWAEEAHRHGLGAFPYISETIDTYGKNRAAVRAMLDTGCDGGIYDHPEMVRSVSGTAPLPALEAMRQFLETRTLPQADELPDDSVGHLAALLVDLGGGPRLSADDLRAAATYAAKRPGADLRGRIGDLLAERG